VKAILNTARSCTFILSSLLSDVMYYVIEDGRQKCTLTGTITEFTSSIHPSRCHFSWICYLAGATMDLHVRHFASTTYNKHIRDSLHISKFRLIKKWNNKMFYNLTFEMRDDTIYLFTYNSFSIKNKSTYISIRINLWRRKKDKENALRKISIC